MIVALARKLLIALWRLAREGHSRADRRAFRNLVVPDTQSRRLALMMESKARVT